MTIGIEAERVNYPQKTGVEHYAKQLILHLAEIDKTNAYILYLRSKPEDWFFKLPKNFKVKVIPFPIFWTQIRISWEMLFHPVDVLMIPASALPIIHPRRCVVTIHDVAWKYFPESFTWFNRNFLEWSTGFAVKNASTIIAVSESTKRDLVKFYGVDEKKVTVVHHGYENNLSAPSDALGGISPQKGRKLQTAPTVSRDPDRSVGTAAVVPSPSEERGRGDRGPLILPQNLGYPREVAVSLPDKYILFLSTLQPRKNLEGLIEAFAQLKKENPEIPHKLVVVGRPGWKFERILEDINRYKDIVIYLNYVGDDERFDILSKADLLVLPSFYEGFGMQILEAFAANVPVATSKISSMPEVAGEAAIYFDPHRIDEIKNAIKSILMDKSLADRLREKGRVRLKDFSWKKCAKESLEALNNA